MNKTRRITANLSEELIEKSIQTIGQGITGTPVEGLEELRRRRFSENALALRGRLNLNIDIEKSRGRRHHR